MNRHPIVRTSYLLALTMTMVVVVSAVVYAGEKTPLMNENRRDANPLPSTKFSWCDQQQVRLIHSKTPKAEQPMATNLPEPESWEEFHSMLAQRMESEPFVYIIASGNVPSEVTQAQDGGISVARLNFSTPE